MTPLNTAFISLIKADPVAAIAARVLGMLTTCLVIATWKTTSFVEWAVFVIAILVVVIVVLLVVVWHASRGTRR